jgi:predicted acylesterase/phospholipase RssA
MKKVLSLDGGGIRGLIPALVLEALERETGRRVVDLFDLVAGSSSGGILALGLVHPGPDGDGYSASELVELFREEGPRIFRRSLWKKLTSLGGLVDEKYRAHALEAVLEGLLGDVPLGRASRPVLVSAYDLAGREPVFFKSWRRRHRTVEMRRVARATTAAPTYFEPERLAVGASHLSLVDGGLFVNNPAMSAYAEARRLFGSSACPGGAGSGGRPAGQAAAAADGGPGQGGPDAGPGPAGDGRDRDLLVVSLGTGSLTRSISHREARGWGLAEWAVPVLDVVFDAVCDAVDYQLTHLLGPDRYFRFQVELEEGRDDLDDASAGNLAALEADGRRLLETHGDRLSRVMELLTRET